MSKELLDFFDFNKNTPSVSAFTQQRSKVLPEAFEYLFKSFTDDTVPYQIAAGRWEKLQFYSYHPGSAATSFSDGGRR